jgi:hypothetical protein
VSPKSQSQKWYDRDCKQMYSQIKSLSSCIKKSPNNLGLIHKYRLLRKSYKKLLNRKKYAFRDNVFKMLDNVENNDPKKFWDIYNDLCDVKKSSGKNPISAREWWNHFSVLMNKNIRNIDTNFDDSINNFWDTCDFSKHELDFDITVEEVIKASHNLKKNKSPGVDGIRNEMLKGGSA